MRPSKPQSKSQQDTTINSELILNAVMKIEIFPHGVNYKPAVEAVTNLIAQEANKARIAELELWFDDVKSFSADIDMRNIENRIEYLRGSLPSKTKASLAAPDLDNPPPDRNIHDKLNRIEAKIDRIAQLTADKEQAE